MDVVHRNQKLLASRWNISEATLERRRSEGNGPKCPRHHSSQAWSHLWKGTQAGANLPGEFVKSSP